MRDDRGPVCTTVHTLCTVSMQPINVWQSCARNSKAKVKRRLGAAGDEGGDKAGQHQWGRTPDMPQLHRELGKG